MRVPYCDINTYYVNRPDRRAIDMRTLGLPEVIVLGYTNYCRAYPPLPEHTHQNVVELAYIESGLQPYKIGRKHLSLAGGEGLLIPPNIKHSSDNHPSYPGKRFWMQFLLPQDNTFDSWMGLSPQEASCLLKLLRNPPVMATRLPADFTCRMYELLSLIDCQYGTPVQHTVMLRVKILSMLFDILQLRMEPLPRGNYVRLQRAIKLIEDNLDKPIGVVEMAECAGLSPSAFKQHFKEYIGITPYAFLLRRRIEHARCMLLEGKNSVTEVAFASGFNSLEHFSTTFKRFVGLTPQGLIKWGTVPLPVQDDGQ